MNAYMFTDRARTVPQMAREEAVGLHHEYVGNLGADLEDIPQKLCSMFAS